MDELINNNLSGGGIPTGPSVAPTGTELPITTMPKVNIGPTDTLSTDSSGTVLRRNPIGTAQSPMLSPTLGNNSGARVAPPSDGAEEPSDVDEGDLAPVNLTDTDTVGTTTTGNLHILGSEVGGITGVNSFSSYVISPSDISDALTNQLVLTQETIDSQISYLKSLAGQRKRP